MWHNVQVSTTTLVNASLFVKDDVSWSVLV